MPIIIKSDEMRIRQIIFNLVSNAVKFTAGNNQKLKDVTINIKWERIEGCLFQIVYKISDTGIGINKETQKKAIFTFYSS